MVGSFGHTWPLAIYFPRCFYEICRVTERELVCFDAQFFCLSAAQNAPLAGCPPAGGAFCAADKQKICATSKLSKIKVSKCIEILYIVSKVTLGSSIMKQGFMLSNSRDGSRKFLLEGFNGHGHSEKLGSFALKTSDNFCF